MNNYIYNSVKVVSGDFKKVKKAIKSDLYKEDIFDFNKIVPCPVELKITAYPARVVSDDEYKNMDTESKYGAYAPINEEVSQHLIKNYGFNNWYEWNCENWGTKRNAFMQKEEDNQFIFYTDTNHPLPVIIRLSIMFPDYIFEVFYENEDNKEYEEYCGHYSIANGAVKYLD